METRQSSTKMAVWWQNHPLKAKLSRILLSGFNTAHPLTFLPQFHADLSRYKENNFVVPVTKTPTFSPPFCAPLAQGATILTRVRFELGLYICV